MKARVVEATRPGSNCHRFFVESASRPGSWYRVDYTPGQQQPFTCSCPRGRVIHGDPMAKACRHLIAVCARVSDEARQAVA